MYRGPLPGRETSVRDQEVLELEGEGLRVAGLVLAAPTRWSKPSGRPTCALTWANLKILQRRERLGFPRRTGLQRGHGVCVGGVIIISFSFPRLSDNAIYTGTAAGSIPWFIALELGKEPS